MDLQPTTPFTEADVVIVGGGPNGLLTAAELALTGVRPIVLERLSERSTWPKANGLVGSVVQMLHYRGLYERFSGSTTPPTPLPGFQFGALPLRLTESPGHSLYALPIPQRRMEEILQERAQGLGVDLRRGHNVTGLDQDMDGVHLNVVGPDGEYQLTATYLVGADGGQSLVRKLSEIDFPGITDDSFVTRTGQVTIPPPTAVPGTGELEIEGVGRLRPTTFTRTENGLFAYGMFQPGLYRVAVREFGQSGLIDSDDMPLTELREAVQRVLGADIPLGEPEGISSALVRRAEGINSRQATRYRHGRVFLVGDSAHVHSGMGGPGLNLGMQDAVNLAWKLSATVHGWAPEGLLDSYESERIAAGNRVIMHTRAQTALASPGPNITALREVFTELLGDPKVAGRIARLMSGADISYDMRASGPSHPLTGSWMPDLSLTVEGRKTSVAHLLHPARPLLIILGSRTELANAGSAWADRVTVVQADALASEPTEEAPENSLGAALVRPDGYVAWATIARPATDAAADLQQALTTWFGVPSAQPAY